MSAFFQAATFGLLVWVDFFFCRSGSTGNETATCALTETIRAYRGAVSTCWSRMQSDESESARGESNTGVPF